MKQNPLRITGQGLTLREIENFHLHKTMIDLTPSVEQLVSQSRMVVERILKDERPVYGINTGFGNFAEVKIKNETVNELQRRLVLSHATGTGDPIPPDIVRLILLLKIQALSSGYSGCRYIIIQMLQDLLNHNVLPVIPEKGSVGASGDLAPLAHMALVMIGLGETFIPEGKGSWKRLGAKEALEAQGLSPIAFEAKEGLAILNGTQVISAFGLDTVIHAQILCKSADIIGAMTLEALLGSLTPFDQRIQNIRPHPGQNVVAANFQKLIGDSPIVESHRDSTHKVQDAYSLRCIPQVHGAVRDALGFAADVLIREANGVTDNPVVFSDTGDVLSGGNFHGAPVGYTCDFMGIVLADLSSMSERRIEHMLDPAVSELPPFLIKEGGLNSGFMIAHVTAASLVSENKMLAFPASVDSIPTSANKEDHVSMGLHAARSAKKISEHLTTVLAIELLCACQALDFRSPLKSAAATQAVLNHVRQYVPHLTEDRMMQPEINLAREMIESGRILEVAEEKCGKIA
jgi:histidine ammonia-lyase